MTDDERSCCSDVPWRQKCAFKRTDILRRVFLLLIDWLLWGTRNDLRTEIKELLK